MNSENSFRVFNLVKKEVCQGISRDITERLKTEDLLRKSEKLTVVGQIGTVIKMVSSLTLFSLSLY